MRLQTGCNLLITSQSPLTACTHPYTSCESCPIKNILRCLGQTPSLHLPPEPNLPPNRSAHSTPCACTPGVLLFKIHRLSLALTARPRSLTTQPAQTILACPHLHQRVVHEARPGAARRKPQHGRVTLVAQVPLRTVLLGGARHRAIVSSDCSDEPGSSASTSQRKRKALKNRVEFTQHCGCCRAREPATCQHPRRRRETRPLQPP